MKMLDRIINKNFMNDKITNFMSILTEDND